MRRLLSSILVFLTIIPSTVRSEPGCLIARIQDPNPREGGRFGWSLQRVGGDFAVSSITEIRSKPGRVYLFNGETGQLILELEHPQLNPSVHFGVTMASHKNLLLVGEPSADAAYLYDCDPKSASFGVVLKTFSNPTPDSWERYGGGLAVTDRYAFVSDPEDDYMAPPDSGSVFLYDIVPNSDTYGELIKTLRSPNPTRDEGFGSLIAIQGNQIAFRNLLMKWNPSTQSLDSNVVELATPGSVTGGIGALTAVGGFFAGGIPDDNNIVNSGGAVHLYSLGYAESPGSIVQTFSDPSPRQGEEFGTSVSSQATELLVGSPYETGGHAYVFDCNADGPNFGQLLSEIYQPHPIRFDRFGWAVASAGANYVVSAPHKYDYVNHLENAGEVFLFQGEPECRQVAQLTVACHGEIQRGTPINSFRCVIYEDYEGLRVCGATQSIPLQTLVDCFVDCTPFQYATGPSCAEFPEFVLDTISEKIDSSLTGVLSVNRIADGSLTIESTIPIQFGICSDEMGLSWEGTTVFSLLGCSVTNLLDGISGNEFEASTGNGVEICFENKDCPPLTPIPTLTPTATPVSPPSGVIPLGFQANDVVIDGTDSVLYAVSPKDGGVYRVDYSTGVVSEPIVLPATPERLDFSPHGRKLAVTVTQGHYDYGGPDLGQIGIIDVDFWSLDELTEVPVDPWDVAADRNGFLYISSGSNQWGRIISLNQQSGGIVSTVENVQDRLYAEMNPVLDSLYLTDTDSSPRKINRYGAQCGVLHSYVKFPYHTDHPAGWHFRFSPKGDRLYTSTGSIFAATDDTENDLLFIGQLPTGFADIAVDGLRKRVYVVNGEDSNVYSYDTESYEAVGYPEDIGLIGKFCFLRSDQLVVIGTTEGRDSEDTWGLTVLSAETWDMQPTPTPTPGYDRNDDRYIDALDLCRLLAEGLFSGDGETIRSIFDFASHWHSSEGD